jgi:hypothetical protein
MAWVYDFRKFRRELPEEWKGIVPTEVFMNESIRLVEAADKRGIPVRILGGLAIAIHSPEATNIAKKLKRVGAGVEQEYSDIDLMTYGKCRKDIERLFTEEKYVARTTTLSSAHSQRQILYHPKGWFYVDVFNDRLLVANHPIDFKGRLELDYPTVPVTDLLLEKIQIWEAFSEKDLKDCLILLKAHDVDGEKNQIDASHIAKLLANDWGFWYTATTNLQKIRESLEKVKIGKEGWLEPSALTKEDREEIIGKIERLLKRIEEEPKSLGWKLRSKIGTKKIWYQIVERPETMWEAKKVE